MWGAGEETMEAKLLQHWLQLIFHRAILGLPKRATVNDSLYCVETSRSISSVDLAV